MNTHVHRRPRTGRRRGQALVEFALVIPIFLLILVGLFDLGSAVFSYNSITNAAREGARLGIVNQDTNAIETRAKAQVAVAEVADPSVSTAFYQDPSLSASCASPAIGCMVEVTFETTYRPITPIISSFIFPSGVTFTARAVLPIEYVCPNTTTLASNCPKQP